MNCRLHYKIKDHISQWKKLYIIVLTIDKVLRKGYAAITLISKTDKLVLEKVRIRCTYVK